MTIALKKQRDLVALEAYSVADLPSLVARVFPAIRKGLTDLVGMFGVQGHGIVSLASNQRDFLRLLEKQNYVDLMPLTAFVPEGLRCSYLEYERELTPAVAHACNIAKVLDPYATYLAVLVSSRDGMLTTQSHTRAYEAMAKTREALNRNIGKCFDKGSTRAEKSLSDVIHRNSDWPAVFKSADAMSVEINKIDRKYLDKKIIECTDLLDVVSRKIEKKEFEQITPEAILLLADGAYAMAEELEFFSATYYRVLAYVTAVDRTIDHVNSVTKHVPDAVKA